MNNGQPEKLRRWTALKTERASYDTRCKEVSRLLLPYAWGDNDEQPNNKTRKDQAIIDPSATLSHRTLTAGMMSGMTSPARPWCRLTTPDAELNDYATVKQWLADSTTLMFKVFAKSNTYNTLHAMYRQLGAFGTAGTLITEHYDNIIHHYPQRGGQYVIATDEYGMVNTVYRRFKMMVGAMVQAYGLDRCSPQVQQMYRDDKHYQWVSVIHAVEPRSNRDYRNKNARNKAFSSCYFEENRQRDDYLRESGFDAFPGAFPRWELEGDEQYGFSPAMDALSGIKSLQHMQKRKAQGIDYKTNPPLQVPESMKDRHVDRMPGGISYYSGDPHSGIRSAFEVNLDLAHLQADIVDTRQLIDRAFYADIMLMMQNSTNKNMTATEVAERHEEKLLMLGPVLERLHSEMLSPLVEITFNRMMQAGILPPVPDELRGVPLNVDFVSILAQAQKAVNTNSVDRFTMALGQMATIKPEVLDRLNVDEWADVYSDALGIDPRLIVPTDKAALVREARAQQQQQANQMAMAQSAAQSAATLASAPTNEANALTDIMGNLSVGL